MTSLNMASGRVSALRVRADLLSGLYSTPSEIMFKVSCDCPLSPRNRFSIFKNIPRGERARVRGTQSRLSSGLPRSPQISPLIRPAATFSPELGGEGADLTSTFENASCQTECSARFRQTMRVRGGHSMTPAKKHHGERLDISLAIQARRADTSIAGGVSHRYATNTNSKARRADTIQGHNMVCRPSGPLSWNHSQSGALRPRQRMCRPSRPESHSKCSESWSWLFSTVQVNHRTRWADALPFVGGMFAP